MKTTISLSVALMMISLTIAAGAGNPLVRDELTSKNGPIVIHPISHASFVIEWDSKTIYVDPVGGADAYQAFGKAQLILLTHTHGDHLDAETLRGISTAETVVVVPSTVAVKLPGDLTLVTEVLANGDRGEWQEAFIEAVPMYNLSEERQRFHPKGDGNGYVVTLGETRIYIAGDSEDIPEMRALKNIDAAFVCMNLPYTMDVQHAADAVLEFAPKIVYPYHYRGTDGMSDIEAFRSLVAANKNIDVRLLAWY